MNLLNPTKAAAVLFAAAVFYIAPVTASATTILIDFGRDDNVTGFNYNNLSIVGANGNGVSTGVVALNDTGGAATGLTAHVIENGSGNGGNAGSGADVGSAPAGILPFEQSAWEDSIFANGGNGSSMVVTLDGLDDGTTYDLLFYGSRANGQNTTQTWQITEGTGGFDVVHASGNNTTTVAEWIALTTNGAGVIEITISGPGSALALNFGSISFEPPTVPEPATATLAMLGLGGLVMRRRRNAA